MSAPEWIEYTGSGRQIEEINASESFLLKRKDGEISFILHPPFELNEMDSETTAEYLICQPHPYADLIKIWADTGCHVWVKPRNKPRSFRISDYENNPDAKLLVGESGVIIVTTKPDWNIPGAEYRLTPFED